MNSLAQMTASLRKRLEAQTEWMQWGTLSFWQLMRCLQVLARHSNLTLLVLQDKSSSMRDPGL